MYPVFVFAPALLLSFCLLIFCLFLVLLAYFYEKVFDETL